MNTTPASQGSDGHGATGGGGPQDLAVGAAHCGGVLAPEPDSAAGVTAIGGATSMTGPAAGVVGAANNTGSGIPGVSPSVGVASTSGSTASADDGDELEVIMAHPRLRALGSGARLSSEVMGMDHFTLRHA
jgi:hypothetical protein